MWAYGLTILSLTASSLAQDNDCWYQSFCPFNALLDEPIPVPTTEDTMEEKMLYCQTECEDANTANAGDCEHFTVFASSRGASCYLLKSCDEPDLNKDCLTDSCNSGPRDCANNPSCPKLPALADDTKIHWQCDNDVNPYNQQIPENTKCFLSCAAWMDDQGEKAVTIQSTCAVGDWSDSIVFGGTAGDAVPSTLPKPDADDGDQLSCGCATLDMAWDTNADGTGDVDYDPNTLLGVDFMCIDDYIVDDQGKKKFKLVDGNTCRLFCDSYHLATMECQGGQWTGEPELGAWCYAEPTADDDMNNGPTEPPTPEPTVPPTVLF